MSTKTEYCPNCGAPCTYSGIGCDYDDKEVQTLKAELAYAIQCFELIEKLQNTVDVSDIVKRLRLVL